MPNTLAEMTFADRAEVVREAVQELQGSGAVQATNREDEPQFMVMMGSDGTYPGDEAENATGQDLVRRIRELEARLANDGTARPLTFADRHRLEVELRQRKQELAEVQAEEPLTSESAEIRELRERLDAGDRELQRIQAGLKGEPDPNRVTYMEPVPYWD